MARLAILGGSGANTLPGLEVVREEAVHTPYGETSAPLTHGLFGGRPLVFLPRHGHGHTIPPHRINYRANLWALKAIGVERVIAVAAVGGIREDLGPRALAVPDQIIDYTWGRDHTFVDTDLDHVMHVDFTRPYCEDLRQVLLRAAAATGQPITRQGTYAATQGPRLESAGEIDRLERDGCDMVGMTGMPEASLARELGLCYACCAVVANWAAGRGPGPITMEDIETHLHAGMAKVRSVLVRAVVSISDPAATRV
jgi:5'-methylthioinosine phosphorylase